MLKAFARRGREPHRQSRARRHHAAAARRDRLAQVLGAAIPGRARIAATLTLWLGMLGAAIAAREGKLLTLATGEFLPKGTHQRRRPHRRRRDRRDDRDDVRAGRGRARPERSAGRRHVIAAGVPNWVADLALPIGFGLIALRLVWRASPLLAGRAIAALGIVAGVLLNEHRAILEGQSLLPWLVAGARRRRARARRSSRCSAASRSLRRSSRGNPPVVLLMMAYQELTTSTGIAAIPLFTLAGFLLAEGRSSERLLRVFRAWVGWAPGGTAIAAATLCAFFTLFTGGSGVTILVLGGLLLPALLGRRLSRALLDRPADGVRIARPALPAVAAADALRHRVAEGVDRGPVHRRAAAGLADARPAALCWACAKG